MVNIRSQSVLMIGNFHYKNQTAWFKSLSLGLSIRLISLYFVRKVFKLPVAFSFLDNNLPADSTVDLLTIDVEGHDFRVLKGLDLNKCRPKVIIEIHLMDNIKKTEIYQYLSEANYSLKYFAVLNAYFVDNNFK
jgi:hypothetical protein